MMEFAGYEPRLAAIQAAGLGDWLRQGRVGLEKEALRVSPAGTISAKPHPAAFGSALTHPYITTDFSEALLELITPPLAERTAVLGFLDDLHAFVQAHLEEELLWGASMPCVLQGGDRIPLARYGSSNAGRMKTIYRRGLGYRYGRTMQVIAGVHYNFSFSADFWAAYQALLGQAGEDPVRFRSEAYLGLVRNILRYGWLIPYLFGASPAVCKTFVEGTETDLVPFDPHTLHYPYATSLRLGDIGYQNRQEEGKGMKANYDSLEDYIRSLSWAITTPCPTYEAIGVKVGDGYRQLNANILQIENEYYSSVRPKALVEWLEKPTQALRRQGVAYIELRSLDVNAFEPNGVAEDQLPFMDAFVRFCLLADSPPIGARERRAIDDNLVLTAHRGREPGLRLDRAGEAVPLREWALALLKALEPLAQLIDGGSPGPCAASLDRQRAKVLDPELTPSARMLAEMRERGESFFGLAQRLSQAHRRAYLARPLAPERRAILEDLSRTSLRRQAEIEAADDLDFDAFLARYLAGA